MKCYKCGETKQLMTQRTNRNGSKSMVCRTCKRNMYHNYKKTDDKDIWRYYQCDDSWIERAKKAEQRILQRYGN